MKKILTILIVAIVVIGGYLLVNKKQDTKVEGSIKIGVIESLSGNAAYYGELNKKGVDLAAQELKQKYPDLDLQIYHADSLYTPKGGVDAYNSLKVQYGLDAVITHASPVALAIKPLTEGDGILQVAVSASASGYSSPDDLSFRTSAVTDLEAKPMAGYIRDRSYTKLAIIYFQNDIGVSIKDSLKAEVTTLSPNTKIVFEEGFVIETTDFRTLLSKIKQTGADAVYIAGLASNIANVINQANDLDINPDFLGFRASEDPVLLTNAPNTSDGFVYTYSFDSQSNNKLVSEFTANFREQYNQEPDVYAAEGYLGLKLIVESFVECGKDYVCIQNYLSGLKNYPSIFGNLSFDQNGDVTYPFFLKVVRDGRFVKLGQ